MVYHHNGLLIKRYIIDYNTCNTILSTHKSIGWTLNRVEFRRSRVHGITVDSHKPSVCVSLVHYYITYSVILSQFTITRSTTMIGLPLCIILLFNIYMCMYVCICSRTCTYIRYTGSFVSIKK